MIALGNFAADITAVNLTPKKCFFYNTSGINTNEDTIEIVNSANVEVLGVNQ
ncbi:hypothetical protein [Candidatus Enterovibrio altilux]|uniref:Uncharacterized protein n=1 Tax=Candidatus Enterovibrio altilux TaxID=1927128 RepID=A0A291B8R8_9GAMM|nr:hypothetical protein [Candidatus Enterovibrio luxaltus]ATF09400.1 hypothetical protein BTN50_0893 [Candidatus Enterovibrio luxaltus]